jgi:hypothetical protein
MTWINTFANHPPPGAQTKDHKKRSSAQNIPKRKENPTEKISVGPEVGNRKYENNEQDADVHDMFHDMFVH